MNKLISLHQQLLTLENSLREKKALFNQCNELEEHLLRLESSIEEVQKNPATNNKTLDSDEEILQALKKKLALINDKIDTFDHIEEEFVKNSQNEFFKEILITFPKEEEQFKEFNVTHEKYRAICQKLENLIYLLKNLLRSLFSVIQNRKRVKKRGLLSFLFGSNPNTYVIKNLKEVEGYKKELLTILNNERSKWLSFSSLTKKLDELEFLLGEFEISYEKVWVSKKFDSEVKSHYTLLFKLKESLVTEEKNLKKELTDVEESLYLWRTSLIKKIS